MEYPKAWSCLSIQGSISGHTARTTAEEGWLCVCVAILTLNIRFLVMYMCVCVTEMGCAGDVNRMVTRDLHIYSTLYCMHMITSGHSWGAAAEVDAVGEQQLKPTQSGSSS